MMLEHHKRRATTPGGLATPSYGCNLADAGHYAESPRPTRFPGPRRTGTGPGERQRSSWAGGDVAAALALHLLDVAGAAETEGPADDAIVVKSQQTQQMTKNLVNIIACQGFSALRKSPVLTAPPGGPGSIANRRAYAPRPA